MPQLPRPCQRFSNGFEPIHLIKSEQLPSVLLGLRRKRRRDPVPFDPFLAVGALAGLLWGTQMVEIWMNLF